MQRCKRILLVQNSKRETKLHTLLVSTNPEAKDPLAGRSKATAVLILHALTAMKDFATVHKTFIVSVKKMIAIQKVSLILV